MKNASAYIFRFAMKIQESIKTAMALAKCRKCGCLQGSLEDIKAKLHKNKAAFESLFNVTKSSLEKMEPIEYT